MCPYLLRHPINGSVIYRLVSLLSQLMRDERQGVEQGPLAVAVLQVAGAVRGAVGLRQEELPVVGGVVVAQRRFE